MKSTADGSMSINISIILFALLITISICHSATHDSDQINGMQISTLINSIDDSLNDGILLWIWVESSDCVLCRQIGLKNTLLSFSKAYPDVDLRFVCDDSISMREIANNNNYYVMQLDGSKASDAKKQMRSGDYVLKYKSGLEISTGNILYDKSSFRSLISVMNNIKIVQFDSLSSVTKIAVKPNVECQLGDYSIQNNSLLFFRANPPALLRYRNLTWDTLSIPDSILYRDVKQSDTRMNIIRQINFPLFRFVSAGIVHGSIWVYGWRIQDLEESDANDSANRGITIRMVPVLLMIGDSAYVDKVIGPFDQSFFGLVFHGDNIIGAQYPYSEKGKVESRPIFSIFESMTNSIIPMLRFDQIKDAVDQREYNMYQKPVFVIDSLGLLHYYESSTCTYFLYDFKRGYLSQIPLNNGFSSGARRNGFFNGDNPRKCYLDRISSSEKSVYLTVRSVNLKDKSKSMIGIDKLVNGVLKPYCILDFTRYQVADIKTQQVNDDFALLVITWVDGTVSVNNVSLTN
ncbi:MAG: hypothetical protein HYX66_00095 [Ignavibacteria bacterium]|nr:hypothetical protein [Ignavibacteria bacterium]